MIEYGISFSRPVYVIRNSNLVDRSAKSRDDHRFIYADSSTSTGSTSATSSVDSASAFASATFSLIAAAVAGSNSSSASSWSVILCSRFPRSVVSRSSTRSPRACSSLRSTLNDSGTLGRLILSFFTIKDDALFRAEMIFHSFWHINSFFLKKCHA